MIPNSRLLWKPKEESMLWGRKAAHGAQWLKLTRNTSKAEQERRRKEGWEVLVVKKGDSPNELS